MGNKFEWNNELVAECCDYVGYNFNKHEHFDSKINELISQFIESKKPKLLYETSDGHKVYSKDVYPIYFVTTDFRLENQEANICKPSEFPFKYFLFEANAIEYIELNNPRLSVADVNYYIKEYGSQHTSCRLIEFANRRQSAKKEGTDYKHDWDN